MILPCKDGFAVIFLCIVNALMYVGIYRVVIFLFYIRVTNFCEFTNKMILITRWERFQFTLLTQTNVLVDNVFKSKNAVPHKVVLLYLLWKLIRAERDEIMRSFQCRYDHLIGNFIGQVWLEVFQGIVRSRLDFNWFMTSIK